MEDTVDYQQALMNEIAGLPQEAFPNLLQIVRLFKESVLVQSRQAALALQDEFDQGSGLAMKLSLNSRRAFHNRDPIKELTRHWQEESVDN